MKKIVIIFVVGALSVTGHLFLGAQGVSLVKAAQAVGNPGANKPSVTVMTLERTKIVETASFPGRVAPDRQVAIKPQVDGIITEVLYQPGTMVKKGQPLYQIDRSRYEVSLASARAEQQQIETNIESLEPRMKRYISLVKNGAVSQQDFEDVRTELDKLKSALLVAKTNVKAAEIDLDFATVRATINGQAGRTLFSNGALARSGQADNTLTIVTQIDPMNVDLQLTMSEAVDLRQRFGIQAGLTVNVMLGNNKTQYPYPGKTMFTEATVEAMTGAVFLRTEFPNPDGVLMPGTYAKAIIDFGEREVLLVPQRATTRKPDGSLTVWVVDSEGTANLRPIQASHAREDQWVVESGIVAGETIIITGYQKIGPGTAVQTQPWVPKSVAEKG
jgi:membrane fusion protein (multidrug efflux system)